MSDQTGTKPRISKRRLLHAELEPASNQWDWDHSPKQVARRIDKDRLITLEDVLNKDECQQAFRILCEPKGKYPGCDPHSLGRRLLSFGLFRPGHNRILGVASSDIRKLKTLPRKLRSLAEEMWGPDLTWEQTKAVAGERFRAGAKSFTYIFPENSPLRWLIRCTPGSSWPKDLWDLPDRMRRAASIIDSEFLGKPHFRAANAQSIRVWFLVDQIKKATGRPHYRELQTLLDGVLDVWHLPERIGSARYLSVIFERRDTKRRVRSKKLSSLKKPDL